MGSGMAARRDVIGQIGSDVTQARRLSQVVCGAVIVAVTLLSSPITRVEPAVAVAGASAAAATAVAAGVLATRAGRRLRN